MMSLVDSSFDFNQFILQPHNLEFYILNYFVANNKNIEDKINKNFSSELILNLIKLIKIQQLKYQFLYNPQPYQNIKNRHYQYLFEAKKEAYKSDLTHQHGCIIVHNKKIVARGHNITHDFEEMNSIHAEIDALNNLNKIVKFKNKRIRKNCCLYIVRIKKCDDTLKMSKPCKHCAERIVKSNIGKVYYSVDNNFVDDMICEHLKNII